jgi:hypothetical protein
MKFFQAREYDAGASPAQSSEPTHQAEDSWTSPQISFLNFTLEWLHQTLMWRVNEAHFVYCKWTLSG